MKDCNLQSGGFQVPLGLKWGWFLRWPGCWKWPSNRLSECVKFFPHSNNGMKPPTWRLSLLTWICASLKLIKRSSVAGAIAFGDHWRSFQWPPYTVQQSPVNALNVLLSLLCLLSINNKLQQPEAASGVLEYAMKHFGELVSTLPFFLFQVWIRGCLKILWNKNILSKAMFSTSQVTVQKKTNAEHKI